MTPETLLLIIAALGTFVGSVIAAQRTNRRVADQSQKMQVVASKANDVDRRVQELESDKAALEEIRQARDKRINALETTVHDLEAKVQTITDEKAEVVKERDELREWKTKAEGKIYDLEISVIKLNARLEAEQNASERIVKPIVEALTRFAVHPQAANLPAEPPSAEVAA